MFIIAYLMIIANVFLLDYQKDSPGGKARLALNVISSMIVFIFIIPFEVIQAIQERWNYFKDANNWNDMLFLLTMILYMSANLYHGTTKEDNLHCKGDEIQHHVKLDLVEALGRLWAEMAVHV